MKISIYGHGGSTNHGNEAIVRGICKLFQNERITLYSFLPEADIKFELDKICDIEAFGREYKRYSLEHIISSVLYRIADGSKIEMKYRFKPFLRRISGIYLLEAGDQYCENSNLRKMYAFLNREIVARGGKTVMLGCTINPEILQNNDVIEDLNKYSLIIARESITYNALINANVKTNTLLAPCPAFAMDSQPCPLPVIFSNSKVVGINVGFLAQGNEAYYELMMKNCEELIKYIVKNTDCNVALIPHVNWSYEKSDFKTLDKLYEKFQYTKRVEVISEHNAPQQKYIMSKCQYMIALRTHVSIPSIAAQVPTLVTGYKVKSTGIVRDIFPENMKLLAHIQSLKTDNDYIDYFLWMQENENKIREYMKEVIPNYINKTQVIYKSIEELFVSK